MSTHASHSHDAIERLIEMRERLDEIIQASQEREKKLHEALVMANAVALLQKISRQSRTSESDRQAAKALAEQLRGAA